MTKTHQQQTLATDLGTKAKVSTEEISGELAHIANCMLKEIGKNIKTIKESEYIGSAAIHFYKPKGMVKYLHFNTQTGPLNDVPEEVASMGFTRFKDDMRVFYGRKRQVKRSGF